MAPLDAPRPSQDKETIETFARFDADSSGAISRDELTSVITMLDPAPTKADVATIIEAMDLNKVRDSSRPATLADGTLTPPAAVVIRTE